MNPATHVVLHLATQAAAAEASLLKRLRDAGAQSPRTAAQVCCEGSFEEDRLKALLRTGTIVEATPGTFYLDEEVLELRAQKQKRNARRLLTYALVIAGGLLVLALTLS
jgi:hypothetical protein